VNGSAAKKQVALGNFLFNVITSLLFLLLLQPVNFLITTIIGIRNNLTGLVFFQSLINLAGIILFYPFLNLFAKGLVKLFKKSDKDTVFIHKIGTGETEYAIDAIQQETRYFLIYVIDFSLNIFKINSADNKKNILPTKYKNDNLEGKYEFIKHVQGELHAYYVDVASASSNKEDTIKLDKLISAVRNGMYAAKSMKDSVQDAEMLRNSSNESKYLFYLETSVTINTFYHKALLIMEQEASSGQFEKLTSLFKEIQDGYTEKLKKLYHHGFVKNLNDVEISSLINFNRQVYTAFKSMGLALKDFLMNEREAAYFDDLPGFIH
jgi:phosphate:Na+ symporter